MSNRVLKKLYGDSTQLKSNSNEDLLSGSESDSLSNNESNNKCIKGQKKGKKLAVNRFELLNNFEHNSMSDTEAKEDDDKDNDSVTNHYLKTNTCDKNRLEKQDSTQSTDSLKKRKKKKKKVRSQRSIDGQLDDIEATVEEVNKLLGNSHEHEVHHKKHESERSHKRSILYVETRHLNAENEMKRIFGSKVIQAEQGSVNRRRGRGRHSISRSWVLVNPKNWQNIGKCGLSMEYIETKDDILYFNIIHNKSYQSVEFQFLDAVESYNPDNLVAILNMHPYHIDTLIQFSDVCKMAEDNQMAAELIERALYCFEHIFHPLFNVTQGNCRIDYRKPENRSFYIALFKHLTFVGQRGCNRTSLEFCKLILGFDPDGDPLSVLSMMDFYAIRSEQYEYLINIYDEWEPEKKLSLLPNFRYSVSLALYYMSQSNKSFELIERANNQLQEALIMFPEVLRQLLDRCSVEPDSQVSNCLYFNTNVQNVPQAINQLIALFIGRSYLLWKDRNIMSWLETNVKEVIKRIQKNDPFIQVCDERRKKYFSGGTPRNVLRHVILSGIKEATLALPPDLSKDAIFGFDPLPPLDSIISYTRPESTAQAVASDQGLLSVFLRSWLPDFNIDDIARNRGNIRNALQPNNDAVEGAVAAPHRQRGDTNDLRRSVTSLLDAMRDLLSNIHMADVPHEGDVESEEDEDQQNDN